MRYLLVLGFASNVYRREPRARIFVSDQLIDEFNLCATWNNFFPILKKFFEKRHPMQPYSELEYYNILMQDSAPLRFYELEVDKNVKHLTVRINIANNDSNYSNGFVTKSTLIKLKVCYLFPLDKRVLLRLQEIKNKNRNSKNYAWYNARKNFLFDITGTGMCWKGVNGQKFESSSDSPLYLHNVGGNGEYVCQLTKKYGILMPTLARACRYTFYGAFINYFFDKYFYYANQRDSH